MKAAAHRRSVLAELGRFLRANVSSTAATVLDWALVTALVWLGVHYLAAAAAGALAGAVTDFTLKRHWAFDGEGKDLLHAEAGRYLVVSGTSLLWNLAVAYGFVDGLRLPPVPGVILASIAVGVAWNYPLHRLWVFRRGRAGAGGAAP